MYQVAQNILGSQELIDICAQHDTRFVIITDDNVNAHYTKLLQKHLNDNNINTDLIVIPAGEESKSRAMKNHIQDQLFELGCGRDTCLLALGGGVITDLTGFVAATFCRGVPCIYLPTTLLCMVDASIGGKTGVNTKYGKNLVGTFTQPAAILSDITTLSTLPEKEYVSGFAEIIKHALIFDKEYFNFLFKHAQALLNRDLEKLSDVIARSCEIKTEVVVEDEKEKTGRREILNFGHTIGHAIELLCEYKMSHGEAVSLGIIVESRMSVEMNLLSEEEFQLIKELLIKFKLPIKLDEEILDSRFRENDSVGLSIIEKLLMDKKTRKKTPRFVLLDKIGFAHPSSVPVEESIIKRALEEIL